MRGSHANVPQDANSEEASGEEEANAEEEEGATALQEEEVRVRRREGRNAVFYFYDPHCDPLAVTYHRRIRGRLRQLTISPKLLRKVLTGPHEVNVLCNRWRLDDGARSYHRKEDPRAFENGGEFPTAATHSGIV